LTYVEPGIWFGDVSIFDGDRRLPELAGTLIGLCMIG